MNKMKDSANNLKKSRPKETKKSEVLKGKKLHKRKSNWRD